MVLDASRCSTAVGAHRASAPARVADPRRSVPGGRQSRMTRGCSVSINCRPWWRGMPGLAGMAKARIFLTDLREVTVRGVDAGKADRSSRTMGPYPAVCSPAAELRLAAYESYGQAIGKLVAAACSLAAETGLMHGSRPVEPNEGARRISAADRDVALAYNPRRSTVLEHCSSESWEASYDQFRTTRTRFQEAARADHNVPGRRADRSPEGKRVIRRRRPDASGMGRSKR
jgi:hypothetical protein